MKEEKNVKDDIEIVTKDIVLNSLTAKFQSINNIAFLINEVRDVMDFYYMEMKLMELEREGLAESILVNDIKFYRKID